MRCAAWALALGIAAGLARQGSPACAARARSLPSIQLTARDAHGCGRVARLARKGLVLLDGAAPGLCVRAAFAARLETDVDKTAVNVVLLVAAPHRFDPAVRTRLFVYRLSGRRLRPRFLGSGFRARTLLGAERLPGPTAAASSRPRDSLRLTTATPTGQRESLRCAFERFPLSCEPERPAPEAPLPSPSPDPQPEAAP